MIARFVTWLLGMIILFTLTGPSVFALGFSLLVWFPVCMFAAQASPQPRRRY